MTIERLKLFTIVMTGTLGVGASIATLVALAGVISATLALWITLASILSGVIIFIFLCNQEGTPGLQAYHFFFGGLTVGVLALTVALVAAYFMHRSGAFSVLDAHAPVDQNAGERPHPSAIEAEVASANARAADAERRNREYQKQIADFQQKAALPWEAQIAFKFSDTPILKHRLAPGEAAPLLSALNEMTSFIAENRPATFDKIMPETVMRLSSSIKIPTFAERRDMTVKSVQAYVKIRDHVYEITNSSKNFADDLKLIIGGDEALSVLMNAVQNLNNVENKLDHVLQRQSPDEDGLARRFISEEANKSKLPMLQAEDWIERLLKTRAPAAREEIRAYL